jgi:hypothetical protein
VEWRRDTGLARSPCSLLQLSAASATDPLLANSQQRVPSCLERGLLPPLDLCMHFDNFEPPIFFVHHFDESLSASETKQIRAEGLDSLAACTACDTQPQSSTMGKVVVWYVVCGDTMLVASLEGVLGRQGRCAVGPCLTVT